MCSLASGAEVVAENEFETMQVVVRHGGIRENEQGKKPPQLPRSFPPLSLSYLSVHHGHCTAASFAHVIPLSRFVAFRWVVLWTIDSEGAAQVVPKGRRHGRPEERHAAAGGLCHRNSNVYGNKEQQEAEGEG